MTPPIDTNTENPSPSKSLLNNKDFIKKIIALGIFALLGLYLASISPSITTLLGLSPF